MVFELTGDVPARELEHGVDCKSHRQCGLQRPGCGSHGDEIEAAKIRTYASGQRHAFGR